MLLNQFITLSVFFHSFTFVSSDKVLFIFCNMCLLILPISFFAGFSNLVVYRFKKFSLRSFNVVKLLPVLLILILLMTFTSLVCLIPSLFIFVAVHLSVFLYFHVIAFCKRFEYSSLLRRYIFDILSAAVKVFFDDRIPLRSLASVLWNLLSTFRNLRFFTNFIKSSSNYTNYFTCGGYLVLFKPNVNPVLCPVGSVRFLPFIKNMAFQLIFLIKSSTFCIRCNL